ncbi:glycosyltransferase [Flavobacterium sp. MC2016-06]|jgi:GT2 family glycosyltransferase|uniref:glycosyltransferase family 2 protein n=1 Tax=Flavobacterium sp. MC2016-06 TaxID=2676308 RepID=UPI0012BAB0AB|nr:glycosyltransferase [Flavobacterium sp. MC2016-06]MBU3858663.1 glycosyltransferase [Flavobacterium sp. MC2016-06]
MLAIIIPYFKLAFFEETLDALVNQTNKRFKVYIGDDASPENPIELLKGYKDRFDFVYHRFEKNLGSISLSQQWDRCISMSGDEQWIMILGDDDILDSDVVEEFYNKIPEIEKNECNVIKFASRTNDIKKKTISKIFEHAKFLDAADFYYNKFKDKERSSLSEHIFRKKTYLKHGFKDYPLAWHSDDYAWLAFSESKPIYCINSAVVTVKISSESISGQYENILQKNKAEAEFFVDILQNKLRLFIKEVRLELLYQTEVSIKKSRKLYFYEWNQLFYGYLTSFSLVSFLKFIRRYLLHFTK